MNCYLASQLIADRQATLTIGLIHRAQLKDVRAAHKASAASAGHPVRTHRRFAGRLALPGA